MGSGKIKTEQTEGLRLVLAKFYTFRLCNHSCSATLARPLLKGKEERKIHCYSPIVSCIGFKATCELKHQTQTQTKQNSKTSIHMGVIKRILGLRTWKLTQVKRLNCSGDTCLPVFIPHATSYSAATNSHFANQWLLTNR